MRPKILVVSVVHWPDDTRIRERLIRSLAEEFDVVYAARSPGPSDRSDLDYVELAGGRLRRNLRALRLGLGRDWDLLVIHDPELVASALIWRLIRRRPVIFDVHEDVPAAAHTRAWVPRPLRAPLAMVMRTVLRVAERTLTVTLAEPGYRRLFARDHPVFPNFPDTTDYPNPGGRPDGPVVYLGDVTFERGADVAVEACSRAQVPLRLIGRVAEETKSRLTTVSGLGDRLVVEGPVSNPDAIEALAESSVGLAPLRDLPNYRHSQPTKILEYLAAGLPVVASDLPGTRDLVEGLDAVVFVPPGDSEALAGAISETRTPELAETARAQAMVVRERFRWPADSVRAFYRSLL